MNIDQLNAQFSDETICRKFFEAARWPEGRICPHCSFNVSRPLHIHPPQPCALLGVVKFLLLSRLKNSHKYYLRRLSY